MLCWALYSSGYPPLNPHLWWIPGIPVRVDDVTYSISILLSTMELCSWMSPGCHPNTNNSILSCSLTIWISLGNTAELDTDGITVIKVKTSFRFYFLISLSRLNYYFKCHGPCLQVMRLIFAGVFCRSTKKGSIEKIHYSLHFVSLSVKREAVIWATAGKDSLTHIKITFTYNLNKVCQITV